MTEATAPFSVVLNGEWNMEDAAGKAKLLRGIVDGVVAGPVPAETVVDMAGITDIDACGAQLLSIFFENLRRLGVSPLPSSLDPRIMESVVLLGFHGAFFPDPIEGSEAT